MHPPICTVCGYDLRSENQPQEWQSQQDAGDNQAAFDPNANIPAGTDANANVKNYVWFCVCFCLYYNTNEGDRWRNEDERSNSGITSKKRLCVESVVKITRPGA